MAIAYQAKCNAKINSWDMYGNQMNCGWKESGLPTRPYRCRRCDSENIEVGETLDFGENKREINWGIDYYEVLELTKNASKADITKKRHLMTKYKDHLDRVVIPQVTEEVKKEFRQKGIEIELKKRHH